MELYYSLAFFVFSYFGSSKGSISHFSCRKSHVSGPIGLFLLYQKNHRIALNPPYPLDLGWAQNHHEISSIFEPVSKARKAMKIGPKATQNHEKSIPE